MSTFMDSMYETRDYEYAAFGRHWCGPDTLPSWDWTLVARYPKQADGDGHDVEVYCSAAPARFYRVVALPTTNSCDEPKAGFSLGTGSSQHELAARMAAAIADGMLGLNADGAA